MAYFLSIQIAIIYVLSVLFRESYKYIAKHRKYGFPYFLTYIIVSLSSIFFTGLILDFIVIKIICWKAIPNDEWASSTAYALTAAVPLSIFIWFILSIVMFFKMKKLKTNTIS